MTTNKKVNVKTLSRVFQVLQVMDLQEIPALNKKDEFEEDFITALIMNLANDTAKLNNFFSLITDESKDFSEDTLDELFEVAQSFFQNIPIKFKNTLKTMIKGQQQQKSLALAEMRKSLDTVMMELQSQITSETSTSDKKSLLESMGLNQKK
jgi:hypothetical protein